MTEKRPIVVSFINMKGGVAKTTLAINIADCLCRRHDSSVLVIDVDPQFNATQCLMTPERYVEHVSNDGSTIVNVFDRSHRPKIGVVSGPMVQSARDLEEIKPITIKHGFDLLPGSLDLYRLEMAPGDGRENRLKRYLNGIASEYDFVIVDTPPTPSVWMTSALIASDYYLIPVRPDPISLTGIDLLRGIVTEKTDNFSLQIKCVGVVLTVVEPNTVVYRNAVNNLESSPDWKDKLFKAKLPKRTEVAKQQLLQNFILDIDDPELTLSIAQITNEILSRIGQ